MVLWELYAIIGVICLILEMVVPSMFFLNLALAAFFTAIFALFIANLASLTFIFIFLSVLSIFLLRPILIKNRKNSQEYKTGFEAKYAGKIVKVIETITKHSGAITIYDERWDARTEKDEEIPEGSDVKIVRNESLIMYVERI